MIREFEIGSARVGDARYIARMSRALIERGLAWRWRPDSIASSIQNSDVEVAVARREGEIVGFAIMQFLFSRNEAHLVLFAVDPAQRRRGVGRALVGWLEKIARAGGIVTIGLEVRADNREAREFYRSLGYAETARLPGYYQKREDAVRMVRRVGRSV